MPKGCTSSNWWSQDLNPGNPTPEYLLLTTERYSFYLKNFLILFYRYVVSHSVAVPQFVQHVPIDEHLGCFQTSVTKIATASKLGHTYGVSYV